MGETIIAPRLFWELDGWDYRGNLAQKLCLVQQKFGLTKTFTDFRTPDGLADGVSGLHSWDCRMWDLPRFQDEHRMISPFTIHPAYIAGLEYPVWSEGQERCPHSRSKLKSKSPFKLEWKENRNWGSEDLGSTSFFTSLSMTLGNGRFKLNTHL